MTVRTTRPARVNAHPARKARQLAGLVSGVCYAGATIGIGVAAAGGSSSVSSSGTQGEGDLAGQQSDNIAPSALGFHLEGGAVPAAVLSTTSAVSRPLVLTAPTTHGESSTTVADIAGGSDTTGRNGQTTMAPTTSPGATTTQPIPTQPATTTDGQGTQATTTDSHPPTTLATSTTEATTTQPPTTQATTTLPPTTQPPTTESGAS